MKLQQSILYFCCSSFPSSDQIVIIITPHPWRELFQAHGSRTKWKLLPEPCRWWSLCTACMQGSDLDVFDVRLEQQMPARWQVGWNVLRSLAPRRRRDRKIRPVWSSTPGGPFQQALPAAPQPWRLCWIIKTTEGWGWSIYFPSPPFKSPETMMLNPLFVDETVQGEWIFIHFFIPHYFTFIRCWGSKSN